MRAKRKVVLLVALAAAPWDCSKGGKAPVPPSGNSGGHQAPAPTPLVLSSDALYRIELPPLVAHPLPPGEHAALVQQHCAGCHSLLYLLNQPRLSHEVWRKEVNKMVTAFGAVIPLGDQNSIVDYLAAKLPAGEGRSAPSLPAAEAAAGASTLGSQVYARMCATCHQLNGQGVRQAFPPLKNHLAELLKVAGGRDYVVAVLLYGVEGSLEVDAVSYQNMMPTMGPRLDDAQIAAVLNHLTFTLVDHSPSVPSFTAQEISQARAKALTPAQVLLLRPPL